MAKLHTLKITNYRGIEKFEHIFGYSDFICLIGRGDSGKTTILQAIDAVLSPNWNYSFNDMDFHKGNITKPIEIEASLYDLPFELLIDSKYGLYKSLLNGKGEIIDDLTQYDSDENKDILTVKLIVKKDLEPRWYIVNNRLNQENIEIRSSDRAKVNVYLISDFINRHFSWGKRSPLYSLLKHEQKHDEIDEILTQAYRKAKSSIDNSSFASFDKILKKIKDAAIHLGLSINDISTLMDFKDTFIKEGNVVLHDDKIPFRMKGKGTKRLLSIAIQLELAKQGGIILIDELEQGLEPDRARFLVKKLKDNNKGQIFVTTHSNNVIVELSVKNIFLMNNDKQSLFSFSEDLQGCIRNNPEAFFAKRIIVCEGATEVGICRALNHFRIHNNKDNLSTLGIALVDGTGSKFIEYCEKFNKAGFDTCAFCDSDDNGINTKKQQLKDRGILIVDCNENQAIEQQLFNDLPWEQVKTLLDYVIDEKSEQSILAITNKTAVDDLKGSNSLEIRKLLGEKAKEKGWFKRIDHGEFIGNLWFNALSNIDDTRLKAQYDKLTKWIEE
jgi:putative ATP-dependent endonuclease of the OLD family